MTPSEKAWREIAGGISAYSASILDRPPPSTMMSGSITFTTDARHFPICCPNRSIAASAQASPAPAAAIPAPAPSPAAADHASLAEKQRLLDALRQAGGNKSQAARILGVTRLTVLTRMRKHGVTCQREITG